MSNSGGAPCGEVLGLACDGRVDTIPTVSIGEGRAHAAGRSFLLESTSTTSTTTATATTSAGTNPTLGPEARWRRDLSPAKQAWGLKSPRIGGGRFATFDILRLIGRAKTKLEIPTLVDGVLEINQNCAVSTGCFSGDAAGYPVTITAGGSYVLTGIVSVSDPNVDAITVNTDAVAIDLDGFEIVGPISCTGLRSAVVCRAGSGEGIDASTRDRVSVHDGRVYGFGSLGIDLGERGRVRNISVESNGATGIIGNTVFDNGTSGIFGGNIVRDNIADSNEGD